MDMSENLDTSSTAPDAAALSRLVCVSDDLGLHARPAARLAQEAQRFEADIELVLGEQHVDAKSILDILTLAASAGSTIELRARGADAEVALDRLEELFRRKFREG